MKNITLLTYLFLMTNVSFAQDVLFHDDLFTWDLLKHSGVKYAYQCGKGKIKKISYRLGYSFGYELYDFITLHFDKEGNLIKRKVKIIYPNKKEKEHYTDANIANSLYDYHYHQDKKISQIDTYSRMDINESYHRNKLRVIYDKNGNISQKIQIYEDEKNNSLFYGDSFSYKYRSDNRLDSIVYMGVEHKTRIHTKDEKKKRNKIITYEFDTPIWKKSAKYMYNSENKLQNIIVRHKYFSGESSDKEIYEVLPNGKKTKGEYMLMSDKHIVCFDKEDNWLFIKPRNNFADKESSRVIEYYK